MSASQRLALIRRLSIFFVGGGAATYVGYKYLDTLKLKQTTKLHIENKPVDLPESLKSLLQEVRTDMKLEDSRKYSFEFFICKGIDIINFGLRDFQEGPYIGIPHYFVFDKDSDIDLTTMMDEGSLPTDPTVLRSLKQSMCLSKEAKKFGLAQEIHKCEQTFLFPSCVLPFLIIANFNALSYILEKSAKQNRKPISVLNHAFLYLMGIWFYVIAYDEYSASVELDGIYKTSQLESSYIQGGLEFYEKMIARNKILKQVQKNSPFTEDGDIKMPLNKKTKLSLFKKLDYLKDIKAGGKEKNFLGFSF